MNTLRNFSLGAMLLNVAPAAFGQYLFSLDELKQLARCPNRACVEELVMPKRYVSDGPSDAKMLRYKPDPALVTSNMLALTVALAPGGNGVTCHTTDPAYVPQLAAACRRAGMQGIEGETTDFEGADDRATWTLRIARTQKSEWNGASLWTCTLAQQLSQATAGIPSRPKPPKPLAIAPSPPRDKAGPWRGTGLYAHRIRTIRRAYARRNARGDTIARAWVEFQFPEFRNEVLNTLLKNRLVGPADYERTAERAIGDYERHIAQLKDEEIGSTMSRDFREETVKVLRETPRFLLLIHDRTSYGAGAAHEQYFESYPVFDKVDLKFLGYDDLLAPGALGTFRRAAEAQFRRDERLAVSASLCRQYLFDDCRFELAKSFRLDPQSLVLVYNPYEGKSFAHGIWVVKLPYKTIQALIKPDYWRVIAQEVAVPKLPIAPPRPVSPTATAVESNPPAGTTSTNLLGATTPEKLAILLLTSLKTNDKKTWLRCMHPDERVESDEASGRQFARHREALEAEGITEWKSVQFSRLTYPLRPSGGNKVDPTKTVPFSTVEFTYKNREYIGRIKLGTFSFHEGKWLVWFSGYPEDCQLIPFPQN